MVGLQEVSHFLKRGESTCFGLFVLGKQELLTLSSKNLPAELYDQVTTGCHKLRGIKFM